MEGGWEGVSKKVPAVCEREFGGGLRKNVEGRVGGIYGREVHSMLVYLMKEFLKAWRR